MKNGKTMNDYEKHIYNEIYNFIKMCHNVKIEADKVELQTINESFNVFKYKFYREYQMNGSMKLWDLYKLLNTIFSLTRKQSNEYVREFLNKDMWKQYE